MEISNMIGFGHPHPEIAIYIEHRPDLDEYQHLNTMRELALGEIDQIVTATGNHWRKIFNVSAKFIYELKQSSLDQPTWQAFRDQVLFQHQSPISLMFSAPPSQSQGEANKSIDIVAGRTYAQKLGVTDLLWLDRYFAVNTERNLIVCPYLDYRQLSNTRIETLVSLVKKLQANQQT